MTKFIIGDIGDIAPFPVAVNSGEVSGSLVIDNTVGPAPAATNALEVTGSVYIGGDLTVVGSTTTIDVTELLIDDKLLTLNDGGVAGSGTGAGIEIEEDGAPTGFIKTDGTGDWTFMGAGTAAAATLTLDIDSSATININGNLTVESASAINQDLTTDASPTFNGLTVTSITGDGSGLTNVGEVSAIANGADNRLVTFSSTSALNGEANLTFDGSVFNIAGGIQHKRTAFVASGPTTTYTPLTTDYVVGIDTTSAAATINLPAASSFEEGQLLVLKDEGGSAGTNNITVNRAGSDAIDASTSITLSSNYAAISIYSNGTDKWHIY